MLSVIDSTRRDIGRPASCYVQILYRRSGIERIYQSRVCDSSIFDSLSPISP